MSGFKQRRAAALAILSSDTKLSRKAGSFLGQVVTDDSDFTPKQAEWFCQLADKAGVQFEGGAYA